MIISIDCGTTNFAISLIDNKTILYYNLINLGKPYNKTFHRVVDVLNTILKHHAVTTILIEQQRNKNI